MNRDIIEVLPTFWSPTNTTLNLLNLGMLYKLSNKGEKREAGVGIFGGGYRRRKWNGEVEESVLKMDKMVRIMVQYGNGQV